MKDDTLASVMPSLRRDDMLLAMKSKL